MRATMGKTMMRTILLLLCLLLPLAGVCEEARVIVATDLHYLAPELTDGGPFFRRLIERADGKVTAYSEELLEAFVQQVIDRGPDALILSGDLTFNGERASHEALAEKLLRDFRVMARTLPQAADLQALFSPLAEALHAAFCAQYPQWASSADVLVPDAAVNSSNQPN